MGDGYFIGRVKTQDLKTLGDHEKPKEYSVRNLEKCDIACVVSCFP